MMRNSRRTSLEARRKAVLSHREAASLVERDLRCPECGFKVGMAYSDSSGHIKSKCQKCKSVSVLNLAYFRRIHLKSKIGHRALRQTDLWT
jgi:phage FluMu protein Com